MHVMQEVQVGRKISKETGKISKKDESFWIIQLFGCLKVYPGSYLYIYITYMPTCIYAYITLKPTTTKGSLLNIIQKKN